MRDEELFEDPNTKDRLGPAFSTYKALYDNRIEQNKRKARALMEQKQNCGWSRLAIVVSTTAVRN